MNKNFYERKIIKKIKKKSKNIVAMFMAILMLISMNGVDNINMIFAAAETIDVVLNAQSLEMSDVNDFSTAQTIAYGVPLLTGENITLAGVASFTAITYLKDDAIERDEYDQIIGWQTIESLKETGGILPVGNYYIGYEGAGSEQDACIFLKYGLKVVPAALSAPTTITFAGTSVSWSAVTSSTQGNSLTAGSTVEYLTKLYEEDGTLLGEKTVTGTTCDFSDMLSSYGNYYCTVQTKPTGANADNYISSEAKKHEFAYADDVAPEISSVKVETNEETGHLWLSATARDVGLGIVAYAFAPEGTPEAQLAWNALDSAVIEEDVTVHGVPSKEGVACVYFKDANGNVSTKSLLDSGSNVRTIEICLENYDRVAKTSAVVYLLEGDILELSKVKPDGLGYQVSGWYTNATFTGSATTNYTVTGAETDGKISFYAKWEEQTLNAQITADLTSVVYGTTVELESSIESGVYGTVSYEWYKCNEDSAEYVKIDGQTTHTLSLSQVADSGEYFVRVRVDIGGGQTPQIEDSSHVTVTIAPRNLYVNIADAQITYTQATPEFGFTLDTTANEEKDAGLVYEDELATVLGTQGDKLTSTYEVLNHVGVYPIQLQSGATLVADNYNVVLESNGNLTVAPKDLSEEDSLVVAFKNDVTNYSYTGEKIVPEVVVTLGGASFTSYTTEATNNINATTTAKITINFNGDYCGSKTLTFTISKDTYTANTHLNKTSWLYGDAYAAISETKNPETGAVTWYYKEKTSPEQVFSTEGATTTRPENAGTYWVYGVIAATKNYGSVTTSPTEYTINKRHIVLTSETKSWSYDGNAHTTSTACEETGDGFAPEEGFQYISITGKITNVGSTSNTIDYRVTSATDEARNYIIEKQEGTLTITSSELANPTTFGWSDSTPGRVQWVAITKAGLTVKYKLSLYRTDNNGASYSLVSTYETSQTYYDFIDDILGDSAENLHGYAVTIQVLPVYGPTDTVNYTTSKESAKTTIRSTSKIVIDKADGDEGVIGVFIGESEASYGDSVTLFAGQSIKLGGLYDNTPVGKYTDMGQHTYTFKVDDYNGYSSGLSTKGYQANYPYYSDCFVNVKVLDNAKPTTLYAYVHSSDASPSIDEFKMTNNTAEKLQNVKATFSIYDGIGLSAYAISSKEWLGGSDPDWQDISSLENSIATPNKDENSRAAYYSGTEYISRPGTYHLWVKDSQGNIKCSSDTYTVFETKFAYASSVVGEETKYDYTDDTEATMDSIYHVSGTTITLPNNSFVKSGYALKNWVGTSGIYGVKNPYNANINETLVAQWTDETYEYTVNYFYMDIDEEGNPYYTRTPQTTASFRAGYDEKIITFEVAGEYDGAITTAILKSQTGYAIDKAHTKKETTITTNGQVINVYYARNTYTITYKITGAGMDTTEYDTYYYGQAITERQKPSKTGYDFVGWTWEDNGQKPDTMPSNNLTVSGYFDAQHTEYKVIYYLQNIDYNAYKQQYLADNYYSIDTTSTESISDIYGTVKVFRTEDAKKIEGFTIKGVRVSYKTEAGVHLYDVNEDGNVIFADVSSATGTVSVPDGEDGTLYVCYYYARNTYKVDLNVWRDGRSTADGADLLYSYPMADSPEHTWEYPYGYQFKSAEISEFSSKESASWTTTYWTNGETKPISAYRLASYTDWSTGEAPTTMPAGDVTVAREYVASTKAPFQVKVYLEKSGDTDGLYNEPVTLYYYGDVGATVSVGNTVESTIQYSSMSSVDPYFIHYEANPSAPNSKLSGEVVEDAQNPLVLSVYFDRKKYDAYIAYFVRDVEGHTTKNYQKTITQKWGTTYTVNPWQYYDYKELGDEPAKAEEDSYRTKKYLVSYNSYHVINGGNSYSPQNRYELVGDYTSSTETYKITVGQGNGTINTTNGTCGTNYTCIYYSEVDYGSDYEVKVNYRAATDLPLTKTFDTITVAGKEYENITFKYRAANKRTIFQVTSRTENTLLEQRVGYSYTYGEVLATYEPVIIDGVEYYIRLNEDKSLYKDEDGSYLIYYADETNQFYYGHRISFNHYNKNKSVGYNLVTEYKEDNGKGGIYQNGLFSFVYRGSGGITQTYTFYNVFYSLTYTYDGDSRSTSHESGSTAKVENNTWSARSGYHIAWYLNGEGEPVTSLLMNSNKHVIGRAVHDDVEINEYASYQLPKIEKVNGQEVEYFSKEIVDALEGSWVKADITTEELSEEEIATRRKSVLSAEFGKLITVGETDYYAEGQDTPTKRFLPREEYYYNGTLVYVKQTRYVISFTEVSMDYENFIMNGTSLNEADTRNRLKGYVQTKPISLEAYYARNSYNLTTSQMVAKTNDTTVKLLYGQTYDVIDPVRTGYSFAGWKYYKVTTDDEGQLVKTPVSDVIHDTGVSGHTKVTMPDYELRLEAQWEAAGFTYNQLTYFFENENKTYNTELFTSIKNASTPHMIKVMINGKEETVKAYYDEEGKLLGVSRENDGLTYYYDRVEEDNSIEESHLFAVARPNVSFVSEEEHFISEYALSDMSIFSFSFVNYQSTLYTNNESLKLTDLATEGDKTADNSFTTEYNMLLTYYYKRLSDNRVRLTPMASDGKSAGMTLVGDGLHYYGEALTLYATVNAGYTFMGWYEAKDVLEYIEGDTVKTYEEMIVGKAQMPASLTGFTLVSDWESKTPVSTDKNYAYTVKTSADYVAITKPGNVDCPTITLKNDREEAYIFDYEDAPENTITAKLGALTGANYVKGYHWYRLYFEPGEKIPDDLTLADFEGKELTGQKTSICNVETGLNAGTYVYLCAVDIGRMDNNRSSQISAMTQIVVESTEDLYYSYDEEYTYDGVSAYNIYFGIHSYLPNNNAIKPYFLTQEEIERYDEANNTTHILDADYALVEFLHDHFEELKEGNYLTNTRPSYREVRVDGKKGNVVPHKVFFYLESSDVNYKNGICDVVSLTVNPATISIVAGKPFTKVYDGTTDVLGNLTDASSDKYELANVENGYYVVNGILSTDENLQLYLDFEAEFDYAHVDAATQVTLSNMWLYEIAEGEARYNYNYQFPSKATSVILSASITQYELAVEWGEERSFVYDGKTKWAPTLVPEFLDEEGNPKPGVPEDAKNVKVEAQNKQMNAGTYSAIAIVLDCDKPKESAEWYNAKDYTFSITNCPYEVTKRYITVKPKEISKYYNGQNQTTTKTETLDEFEFWTKEKESDENWTQDYTLAPGQSFTVSAAYSSSPDVGDYTILAKNLKIILDGKNINDNYVISYGSDTLHITPRPVVVSGIEANDKDYDGTTATTVKSENGIVNNTTFSRVMEDGSVLEGLYDEDVLSLKADHVTAEFVTPRVGTDKVVNLTYATEGILIGERASNYVFVVADGEIESQKQTTANVRSVGIEAALNNANVYYGDGITISQGYTGFMDGDDSTNHPVTGEATYIVKKQVVHSHEEPIYAKDADGEYVLDTEGEKIQTGSETVVDSIEYVTVLDSVEHVDETNTLDAGNYYIFLEENADGTVKGLSNADYKVYWDKEPSMLTVKKRPISVSAVGGYNLTKEYDGKTSAPNDFAKDVQYQFGTVSGYTASGVLAKDASSVSAKCGAVAYNVATVAANKVTYSNISLTSGGRNYELKNSSFEVPATITPKALSITVADDEITYGDAVTSVTKKIESVEGLVETDEDFVAAIEAATVLTTDYDTSVVDKRKVGTYKLSGSGYTNANYTVNYVDGTLTVAKKQVHITANNQEVIYGTKNVSDWASYLEGFDGTFKLSEFCYGETPATAGLYYGGDKTAYVADGEHLELAKSPVTYQCTATATSETGNYKITPQINGLSSDNYEFVAADGKLTIKKHYISIQGVEVLGKTYDGSTRVDTDSIVTKRVTYTYYELGIKHEEKVTEEFLQYINITAKYRDKNVGDNKLVDVNITLKDGDEGSEAYYLAKRYVLLTAETLPDAIANGIEGYTESTPVTQTETTAYILSAGGKKVYEGVIARRPLTLTTEPLHIKYGESIQVVADNSVLTSAEAIAKYASVNSGTTNKTAYVVAGGSSLTSFAPADGTPENYSDIGFELRYTIKNVGDRSYTADALNGYSDTGKYTISIASSSYDSAGAEKEIGKNYSVNYAPALLTVDQNKLKAPEVAWASTIGNVTFGKVSGIGAVEVDHYEVSLYRDDVLVTIKDQVEDGSSNYTVSFVDEMHVAAGAYTVKVKAIASLTNNTANKNVLDSEQSAATSKVYSAKVKVVFADTEDTVAATGGTESKITIGIEETATEMIVIAGEHNIPVKSSWKNADGYTTGYKVSSFVSDAGTITIGTGADATEQQKLVISNINDTAEAGGYAAKISLHDKMKDASDITITLTLSARAATLDPTLVKVNTAAQDGKTVFGYSESASPVYRMDAVPKVEDNVTKDEYTYTYTWTYMKAGKSDTKVTSDNTTNQYTLVQDLGCYSSGYIIACNVTATRKDNGKSTTGMKYYNFKVERAVPDKSFAAANVENGFWTYGEERKTPAVSVTISELESATKILYYSLSDMVYEEADATHAKDAFVNPIRWSQNPPTDVGSYYVQAYVEATENYDAFYSQVTQFEIKKAKLSEPEGFKMAYSQEAPYGTLQWNVVNGPVENANAGGVSAGTVGVNYVVKMYQKDGAGNYQEIILPDSYNHLATNTCSVASYMKSTGDYKFEVQAISLDETNCDDSTVASFEVTLHADISVTGYERIDENEYERTYDGNVIHLDITNSTATHYQWYYNGEAISGTRGNQPTYDIRYAEESGYYVCEVTIDGQVCPTTYVKVKILPRTITVATGSATKEYDGRALTRDAWWIVENNSDAKATESQSVVEVATGNTISGMDITGTVTNVGTTPTDNTVDFTGVTITEPGGKVVYNASMISPNYTLVTEKNSESTLGKLQVTTRSLGSGTVVPNTNISISDFVDKEYDGTEKTQSIVITDASLPEGEQTVATSEYTVSYSSNVNVGTVTVTIAGKNNYTGSFKKTFEITKRPVTLLSEDKTATYTGNALTSSSGNTQDSMASDVTKLTPTGLATGDSLASVKFTGTITNVGTTPNTYTNVVIKNSASQDVTANYAITSNTGTLQVTRASDTVVITQDISKTYDKLLVANPGARGVGVSYKNDNPGTLSFKYYSKVGDVYTEISNPVAAGTYYVKAFVGASQNYDAAESIGYKEFTIAPKPVSFQWSNTDYVYANTPYTVTATIINGCEGDEVSVGSYESAGSTVNVATNTGSYTAKVLSITGADAANYTLTGAINASKGWQIVPAVRTISVSPVEHVYDAATHGVLPSDNGDDHAVAGYSCTISYERVNADATTTPIEGEPIHAGTYVAKILVTATNNYKSAQKETTVTITKRPITVLSETNEKAYDGTALTDHTALAVTGGMGLATGDSIIGTTFTGTITDVKRTSGAVDTVSNTYEDVVIRNSDSEIGVTTSDYIITSNYGTLKILPIADTISVSCQDVVYSKTPVSFESDVVTRNGVGNISFKFFKYEGGNYQEITALTNVGTYYVKAFETEAGNYIASESDYAAFAITPADITLSVDNKQGEYGKAIKELTYQVTTGTLYDGDDLGILLETTATAGSAIGSYPITLSYQNNANYNVTVVNGVYGIGLAEMEYQGKDTTVVYDALPHEINVSTVVPSQGATIYYAQEPLDSSNYLSTGSTEAISYRDAGEHTVYYYIVAENYIDVAGYATVSIAKRPLALKVKDETKEYDGTSLVASKYEITEGSLAGEDKIDSVSFMGEIVIPKEEKATISEIHIKDGLVDVTSNYELSLLPGTLKITEIQIDDFDIREDITIPYGTGEIIFLIVTSEEISERVNASVVSAQNVIDSVLTPEEKLLVADGGKLQIRLTVKRMENDVPKQDEELIAEEMKATSKDIPGLVLGDYIDIILDRKIDDNDWQNIPETTYDIDITFEIPEHIKIEEMTYYVMRCHNAKVKLLYDLDQSPDTITISTRYFSTYAVLYTELEQQVTTEEQNPSQEQKPTGNTATKPRTSDVDDPARLWMMLFAGIALSAAAVARKRRRKSSV